MPLSRLLCDVGREIRVGLSTMLFKHLFFWLQETHIQEVTSVCKKRKEFRNVIMQERSGELQKVDESLALRGRLSHQQLWMWQQTLLCVCSFLNPWNRHLQLFFHPQQFIKSQSFGLKFNAFYFLFWASLKGTAKGFKLATSFTRKFKLPALGHMGNGFVPSSSTLRGEKKIWTWRISCCS